MKNRNPRARLVIVLLGTGLISTLVASAFYYAAIFHGNFNGWSEFGDFVGGATAPILTTLTFLALLYTIWVQSNELALSREELSLSRTELARSADALSGQLIAIDSQTFERTLFESLRFLDSITADWELKPYLHDQYVRGRSVLGAIASYKTSFGIDLVIPENGDDLYNNQHVIAFLDRFHDKVGVYHRTLYNIYRYLDDSKYKDRIFYSRIIRAQIPEGGFVLLSYSSLTDRGKKFQKYIARYEVLDNLRPSD